MVLPVEVDLAQHVRHVGDVLEEKSEDVVWISPLESVFDALKLMNEHDISVVLVQIDGYLVGILTERDYIRKVILDIHASEQTRVSEVMSRDLVTVTRDHTVHHCIALAKKYHIHHLPVVEVGKTIGMISLRDLFFEAIEAEFGPVAQDA
jgi:CBS domain-containing protein